MPTFIFMREGVVIDKVVGAAKDEIHAKLEQHSVAVASAWLSTASLFFISLCLICLVFNNKSLSTFPPESSSQKNIDINVLFVSWLQAFGCENKLLQTSCLAAMLIFNVTLEIVLLLRQRLQYLVYIFSFDQKSRSAIFNLSYWTIFDSRLVSEQRIICYKWREPLWFSETLLTIS